MKFTTVIILGLACMPVQPAHAASLDDIEIELDTIQSNQREAARWAQFDRWISDYRAETRRMQLENQMELQQMQMMNLFNQLHSGEAGSKQ